MPTTRLSFAIAAIFACSAFAQTGKVIYLTHVETPQDLQEVTNVVRSIAEIRDVTPDQTKMSITVHGTADQNALAQWLCGEMDRAAPQPAGTQQYTVPHSDVPAVQVFFLAQMNTPQFLQEAVNAVRSVADIQRFFPYNARHAIVARGTAEQVALAAWLVQLLDQPSGQPVNEYRVTGDRNPIVSLVYLAENQPPQSVQEMVSAVRTETQMQRIFGSTVCHAVAMRGTADQVSRAGELIKALTK